MPEPSSGLPREPARDEAEPARRRRLRLPRARPAHPQPRHVRQRRSDTVATADFYDPDLWNIEGGSENLSIRQIACVADALGVTMAELLDTALRDRGDARARPHARKTGSDQRTKRGRRSKADREPDPTNSEILRAAKITATLVLPQFQEACGSSI